MNCEFMLKFQGQQNLGLFSKPLCWTMTVFSDILVVKTNIWRATTHNTELQRRRNSLWKMSKARVDGMGNCGLINQIISQVLKYHTGFFNSNNILKTRSNILIVQIRIFNILIYKTIDPFQRQCAVPFSI